MNNFFLNLLNFFYSKISLLLDKKRKTNWFTASLSLKNQIFFIKSLAILIKAGIPLFASLQMIEQQIQKRKINKILNQIIKDVENGQYLSVALVKFKKNFGEFTVNFIATGEISGNLGVNLDRLSEFLKKKHMLRRKLISTSIYPIFIVLSTIVITIMLITFVFPKIIPILQSINYQLPITTKFLIFFSTALQKYWLFIIFFIVFLILIIIFLLKNEKTRFLNHKLLLSIPILNQLIKSYNILNICYTMNLLLNSGSGIVKSLQITSNVTTNLCYKKELKNITGNVIKGSSISNQMIKSIKLFPVMVSQMLSVGENTGKLSETFLYLSDFYENEINEITKNLSTIFEPLLLIFMGLLVGFIAVSIITPIYGITQYVSPR